MRALLADIGGTNARFALMTEAGPGPPLTLPVVAHPSAEAALAAALTLLAPQGGVTQAVLAIAGPVPADGALAQLTNATWRFDAPAIAARFGLARVRLVNDFLAQAHALPHLCADDLLRIGDGAAMPGAPMLVLGPGTGLGAAGLLQTPSGPLAVPTEGGHITLAAADAQQESIIAALRLRCGRAGAEEALSGRGLEALHDILATLHGAMVPARDAAAVIAAADACPIAQATRELFLDLLASYAGDMALAWGARGGVFIAGGILPRLADRLDAPRFRAAFEAKAPMAGYMMTIPLAVVLHPTPAFLGLAALARQSAP